MKKLLHLLEYETVKLYNHEAGMSGDADAIRALCCGRNKRRFDHACDHAASCWSSSSAPACAEAAGRSLHSGASVVRSTRDDTSLSARSISAAVDFSAPAAQNATPENVTKDGCADMDKKG